MRQIIMNLDSTDSYLYFGELLRQGENLSAELIINLSEEFQGYRYLLVFQLNENEALHTEEIIPTDGKLTYQITKELLTEPGTLKVEVQAFEQIDADNRKIIKSAIAKLKVIEALEGAVEIMPEPYIPWYVQAVEASTTATEQAAIATTAKNEVEDIRDGIVTEETERQAAEDIRVQAENYRVTNEVDRVDKESTRQSNEADRVENEGLRVLSEVERQATEDTRKSNEQNRETSESAREQAEGIRANNEADRIINENARKTAEQNRIDEESTRADSEIGRVTAENNRILAEGDRAIAENDRADAENIRVAAEDGRIVNEADRQNNETTRVLAEQGRVDAEQLREQTIAGLDGRFKQQELKVLKVEKNVDEYQKVMSQVNINQEAKQKASGYGIVSLPKNAANGQVSDVVIKGSNIVQVTPYQISKWRRCNVLDDGTVTAYYGQAGYKEDGSNGQVMVEIHKGYVRTEFSDNQRRDYISEYPVAGFEVHPAFIRNGREINKVYIGAFEGSIFDVSANSYLLSDEQIADFNTDKLCSIAGAKPCSGQTQSLTLPNSRLIAQNRGEGWELQDFWTISFIQMCLFVEHGTFNSQSAIGQGVTNIDDTKAGNTLNNSVITGLTSSLGNATGQTPYTYTYPDLSTITTYPCSYHGVENLWGNLWKWVDGINVLDNVPYVSDHDFISDKFDEHYKPLGVTLANINGYVEDWANFKHGFLPTKIGTNKIGDYYYQSSGARVALLGGSWAYWSSAGVACWNLDSSSASRYRSIGARLLYVPQN